MTPEHYLLQLATEWQAFSSEQCVAGRERPVLGGRASAVFEDETHDRCQRMDLPRVPLSRR